MSLKWDLAVLLAKTEVTPGLDPVPTNVANAMLAYNIAIKPMQGQDVERDKALPFFSGKQKFPTNLYQELTFETELIGAAAAGTAPAWAPLLKASGMAETVVEATSVTYNPVTAGLGSATLYFWRDGQRHTLRYARGTFKAVLNVHAIPKMQWSFLGIYDPPSNVANPLPTLSGFQDPLVVNKANTPTFTLNGVACVMRNFELDAGVKNVYRELVNAQTVETTDREPMVSAQIEAVPLATINPWLLAANQTPFAVNMVHGVGAGKIITVNAPNCRMQRPQGDAQQDKIIEWPLQITALPTAGSDDFTIALS